MTPTKQQAQAALDWFNKANWNPNIDEIKTIRQALQSIIDEPAQRGYSSAGGEGE